MILSRQLLRCPLVLLFITLQPWLNGKILVKGTPASYGGKMVFRGSEGYEVSFDYMYIAFPLKQLWQRRFQTFLTN